MITKLRTSFFPDDDIHFFNEDSGNVTFPNDETDILSIDVNSTNLDEVNFDEDHPETIIHANLIAWRNKLKQRKSFKNNISKELMPVAQHQTRWRG